MNSKIDTQQNLFGGPESASREKSEEQKKPLAYSMRPNHLEDFVGATSLLQKYPFLKGSHLPSIILHGPPGIGKTTLAEILAIRGNLELYKFNAVLGGVSDLRKLIDSAIEMKPFSGKNAVIFIDEIHRFNKAQQDALLPYVEAGDFTLIGATTENPKTSINKALISRVKLVELSPLENQDLESLLQKASELNKLGISDEFIHYISHNSNGDARNALNLLELAANSEELDFDRLKAMVLESARDYDKNEDRHYDVISAFIKSMRGSDPNAALLYLAIMLDGGEDPVFIARRLVIFASEDVGNADPTALSIATDVLFTVQNIGMPEARISLAQAATYLASTHKSNACYNGINQALAYVKENPTIAVPTHLRNLHPDKKNYKYPHTYEKSFVKQAYTEEKIEKFYQPKSIGREGQLKERLDSIWKD